MNQEKIGPHAVVCYKILPFDLTFYERDGFCQIPEENCPKIQCLDVPVCRKKTKTGNTLPVEATA